MSKEVQLLERILRCDLEGPLNDCIDNDGNPYQSEYLADVLKEAKELLTPPCIFCSEPAGLDSVSDSFGEVACRECGEAEISAQSAEASDADQ